MPGIIVKEGETLDFAIRKLKRAVEKAGLPKELRRREFYEPPSKVRKRNMAAARKRMLKKTLRETLFVRKNNIR